MKSVEFKKLLTGGGGRIGRFTNEHDEKFEVYVTPTSIFFASDETDWNVIPLFNPDFNIWTYKEMKLLAQSILDAK